MRSEQHSEEQSTTAQVTPSLRQEEATLTASLIALAHKEARRRKHWRWPIVLPLIFIITRGPIVNYFGPLPPPLSAVMLYVCLGWFLWIVLGSNRRTGKLETILSDLLNVADVQALGALLEARQAFLEDTGLQQRLDASLAHLLSRVQAGDAGLLNESQRALLYHFLLESVADPVLRRPVMDLATITIQAHNPLFTLAMLHAIEQIGDERAIPTVQRLASGNATTVTAREIQERATGCLSALQFRLERERLHQTLLRPATSPDSAEVLLRPARNVQEVDPKQLLRPSDAPE